MNKFDCYACVFFTTYAMRYISNILKVAKIRDCVVWSWRKDGRLGLLLRSFVHVSGSVFRRHVQARIEAINSKVVQVIAGIKCIKYLMSDMALKNYLII